MSGKLFVQAPSNKWQRNALVGGIYSNSNRQIQGYYKAAEILANSAIESGRNENDLLFFPICFNYRHYVELSIKNLIVNAEIFYAILDDIDAAHGKLDKFVQNDLEVHSLEVLFNLLVERLQLITEEQFSDKIRKILMQLHAFDPDGQTFRYIYRKDGSLALPNHEWYDIEVIKRRMKDVHSYLSAIDSWIHANINLAMDYISALGDYHGFCTIEESNTFQD